MAEYQKIGNDTKIKGDMKLHAFLELEGICRGVVCVPIQGKSSDESTIYAYNGILQRANGELVEFAGEGDALEAVIAKTSSEMGTSVTMQCFYPLDQIHVNGLKMGDIKSKRYEE
jgi:hypothetical protein